MSRKELQKEFEACAHRTDFHIEKARELMKKDKLSVEAAEHIHQAAIWNGKAIEINSKLINRWF